MAVHRLDRLSEGGTEGPSRSGAGAVVVGHPRCRRSPPRHERFWRKPCHASARSTTGLEPRLRCCSTSAGSNPRSASRREPSHRRGPANNDFPVERVRTPGAGIGAPIGAGPFRVGAARTLAMSYGPAARDRARRGLHRQSKHGARGRLGKVTFTDPLPWRRFRGLSRPGGSPQLPRPALSTTSTTHDNGKIQESSGTVDLDRQGCTPTGNERPRERRPRARATQGTATLAARVPPVARDQHADHRRPGEPEPTPAPTPLGPRLTDAAPSGPAPWRDGSPGGGAAASSPGGS